MHPFQYIYFDKNTVTLKDFSAVEGLKSYVNNAHQCMKLELKFQGLCT